MSVELITGYSGTPHISSDDQGHMHAGLVGGECYALDTGNGLALAMESANKATIATGDAVMYGRHVRVETPESVTVESGTQSQKRNDIVGLLYSKDASSGVESVAAHVYRGTPTTGTPADPSYPTASILDGASEAFMPLWRVPLDGVSVGTPEKLFETSPTAASLQEQIDSVRESVSRIAVRSGDTERYSVTNGTYYSKTVPFGAEFEEPPMVSVAPSYNGVHAYRIELSSRTKTSFTFGFIASVTGNVSFAWQAIGRLA